MPSLDDFPWMHTPIEEHLAELATAEATPMVAVVACLARVEEAAPALLEVLALAADSVELTEDDDRLLFRGLHILGGACSGLGFGLLFRFLRRPGPEVDEILGDVITESLSRIVIGMFDGDVDALFEAIRDKSADEYVRDALLGAAAFLAWEGRIPLERMKAFLIQFDEERMADDEDYVWIGWLTAIALLGLRDMAPRVEEAWRDGRVMPNVTTLEYFYLDLDRAEREPDSNGRFEFEHLGYIEDVYQSLSRWDRHEEEVPAGRGGGGFRSGFEPKDPVINPYRDVGRNDPCPCGSGKKFKKCCIDALQPA